MEKSNDLRTGRHCVFLMHTHLVFVTKYRRKIFTEEILNHLKTVFTRVCQDFEATLNECDGGKDHVHLLVNYHPKIAISKLVNSLKGVSSRELRKKGYPSVTQNLYGKQLWSPSYFAGSCGGAPLEIVKKYIENQRRPS